MKKIIRQSLLAVAGLMILNGPVLSNSPGEKEQAEIIFGDNTTIYNGEPQTISFTTNPQGLAVEIKYNGSTSIPVNAATYNVEATIIDENFEGTSSTQFFVYKAVAEISFSNSTVTYDGTGKQISYETVPEGVNIEISYDNEIELPVNAGVYRVVGIVKDQNYKGGKVNTFTINKATATVEIVVPITNYDGQTHGALVNTTPENLAYSIVYNKSANLPLNAGEYEVEVDIEDANYVGYQSEILRIGKATIPVNIQAGDVTYDGIGKSVEVSSSVEGIDIEVYYNGSKNLPVNAGQYAVSAIVNDVNYEGNSSANFTIKKALAQVVLDELQPVYNGKELMVKAETQPKGLPVDIFYNGEVNAPTNAGNYEIVALINDKNYTGSIEDTLEIMPSPQEIEWEQDFVDIKKGAEIYLEAQSTSGMEVIYETSDISIAAVENNYLKLKKAGAFVLSAIQGGDENYKQVIKNIELVVEEVIEQEDRKIEEIEKEEEELQVSIMPNPVEDQFQINTNASDVLEVMVISGTGSVVKHQSSSPFNPFINISDIPTGWYLVKIIVGDKLKQFTILKN